MSSTHEALLRTFVYEPETGLLRKVLNARKPYPWRGVGKDRRYLAGYFDGRQYYLHRLVWFYHHGELPVSDVDHVDGDTRNNRIENLRLCTNSQNQFNSPRKVTNRAGFKGVVFVAACTKRPWHAKINIGGRRIGLGYYATAGEAALAYAAGAPAVAHEFARAELLPKNFGQEL